MGVAETEDDAEVAVLFKGYEELDSTDDVALLRSLLDVLKTGAGVWMVDSELDVVVATTIALLVDKPTELEIEPPAYKRVEEGPVEELDVTLLAVLVTELRIPPVELLDEALE